MVTITPEIKAQLNEAKQYCPFCKIINREIDSDTVYEDNLMKGILDINPWVNGHVLLMPLEHYPIMPYLPFETFNHFFGKMAKFVKDLKKARISTGANIVIANGAAAGQQSPHFLVHVLPREEDDGLFDIYSFSENKNLDWEAMNQTQKMLKQNIPIMMNNHFIRNPQSWHTQRFETNEIYEDEKSIVSIPENPQCIGHLKIISKEEKNFEDLSEESSAHLFFVASFCATAVFEGLGAHGSNIILKTGKSLDSKGKMEIHVLPRYEEDGLNIIGKPTPNKLDSASIAEMIRDAVNNFEIESKINKEENNIELKPKIEIITEKNTWLPKRIP